MTSRLSQSGKESCISQVADMLSLYCEYAVPCDLTFEEYAPFAYSDAEKAAFDAIISSRHQDRGWRGGLIEGDGTLTIEVKCLAYKRTFLPAVTKLQLVTRNPWPYPPATITDADITDGAALKRLLEFVVKAEQVRGHWRKFRLLARQVLFGVDCPHFGVNTPGQLFAVWPEFASLACADYRQRIAQQKVKSKLPKDMSQEWVDEFQRGQDKLAIDKMLMVISAIGPDEIRNSVMETPYPL